MKYTAIALAVALAAFNANANDESSDLDSMDSLDSSIELADESFDEDFEYDLDESFEEESFVASDDETMTAEDEQSAFGEQSKDSVSEVKSPRKEIKSLMDQYKIDVETQLNEAGKSHLVSLTTGTAAVGVDKANPDWSRYRANAIRRAVADAKQSHLENLNTSTRNSSITEFFQDEGAPTPTADDFKSESRMGSVYEKAVALMEAKLDSALEEEGIDPETFKSASKQKKQELMRDYFAETTITEAFGDMSGMFVIKTFEMYDNSGKGRIGVVLAKSLKKRDQLKALIESKGQVKPDVAMANPAFSNIQAALSSNKTPYLEYGTSVEYDDKGYPMIISYGQAGVRYTDNDRLMDKKIKAAYKQARSNALANLAQTYNMSGNFVGKVSEERSDVQEVVHTLANSTSVSTMDPGSVETLRTVIDQAAKMTSSIQNLNGLRTVNKWEMSHPITGHEMVGVAVVWHPIHVRNAEAMQSGKTAKQIEDAQPRKESGILTTQQSKSRFNAADF
ncbi:hypothetical protein MAQ5080_02381 [Marinomonas aquimarina]|uniref:DUF6844 domain-containing protein n=1 Tax=Marinomonas aquimarina TaxID=295068 RepID=A0A1A8THV4_9GAMM|nr:hypothetical protein [Marinomonas aquimarina]SBS32859.1 hypothetical protein MAQ5080_02381 [Marinomonas aquimarina]